MPESGPLISERSSQSTGWSYGSSSRQSATPAMLQHQWRNNKYLPQRYDVIGRDRHIGKFGKRSEAGEV
jgi:hypothetical protein